MTQSYLDRRLKTMRFMGFRHCPNCKECLFAAERAQFAEDTGITLYWRCDTCSHGFTTTVDPRGGRTMTAPPGSMPDELNSVGSGPDSATGPSRGPSAFRASITSSSGCEPWRQSRMVKMANHR
jgi:hypothetical protein